jgi:hypothetical protein
MDAAVQKNRIRHFGVPTVASDEVMTIALVAVNGVTTDDQTNDKEHDEVYHSDSEDDEA